MTLLQKHTKEIIKKQIQGVKFVIQSFLFVSEIQAK